MGVTTLDPSRWAVEVYGLEKRFVTRRVLPENTSMGPADWIISTLLKYGQQPRWVRAVDGVDLQVGWGEIHGLLGPNGAGKTTLIKCLATLLELDAGQAYVNGYSVRTHPDEVRLSMNLVGTGHWMAFDWGLTVTQNLHFFGSLYGLNRRERQARIEQVLQHVKLSHLASATPRTLSSGERQRMLLAKGFMIRTPVFFLDEPTVGLDPEGARDVRQFIQRQLVHPTARTAAILTTHRMVEAEALCSRIAIMNQGRIVACGTPLELKKLAGERTVLEIRAQSFPLAAVTDVRRIEGIWSAATAPVGDEGLEESLRVHCADVDRVVDTIVDTLKRHSVEAISVEMEEPTLEDAFIALTDRRLDA